MRRYRLDMAKTMSKRDRMTIIKHARSAAAAGHEALARALFAEVGISYVTGAQVRAALAQGSN